MKVYLICAVLPGSPGFHVRAYHSQHEADTVAVELNKAGEYDYVVEELELV